MTEKKLSMQSNILWNTIGSMTYMVSQGLISILVVRLANVETAGYLSLAMSVNNVFYSIAMFGMRNYQVTDIREKYDNGTYIQSRLFSCAAAFLLCIGYCMLISYTPEQKGCILIYCIFKMSEAMYDVYAGICQKAWHMDCIGKSWILRAALTFSGFVGTLWLWQNLQLSITVMAVLSYLVIFLYDIPKTKQYGDVRISRQLENTSALMKECFPLLCYLLVSTAVATVPRLIMERELGSYAMGIYGSVSVPTLIVQTGASYIFNPFMTLFAEQYVKKQEKEFWQTFRKCMAAVAVICVAALIGGRIFGKWGLALLYGEEVASYVELLQPLLVCTVLTAMVWLFCGLMTVIRDFRGLLLSNILALAVSCSATWLLLKPMGMQGVSAALIIALLVEAVSLYFFMLRKTKTDFAQKQEDEE